MAQKAIGKSFTGELLAAGIPSLPSVSMGSDGMIQCHVKTDDIYYLVKITCEVGGSAVETRTAEIVGIYPCVTEANITAIKNCLTAHNPATPEPKSQQELDCEAAKAAIDKAVASGTTKDIQAALAAVKKVI